VTSFGINGDTIGETAIGYDGLPVGAIRIHQMNTAGVQLENDQTADRSFAAGCRS
jgi:hypothetical protein